MLNILLIFVFHTVVSRFRQVFCLLIKFVYRFVKQVSIVWFRQCCCAIVAVANGREGEREGSKQEMKINDGNEEKKIRVSLKWWQSKTKNHSTRKNLEWTTTQTNHENLWYIVVICPSNEKDRSTVSIGLRINCKASINSISGALASANIFAKATVAAAAVVPSFVCCVVQIFSIYFGSR